MGHKAQIIHPDSLLSVITDTMNDRIYLNQKNVTRLYKKDIAAIIPRIGYNLSFHSKSVEQLNKNIGIPTTATATGLLNAQDKIRTCQLLSQHRILIPKTIPIRAVNNLDWIVQELGGFPIVAKIIYGSKGVGVFILNDAVSASTGLEAFTANGHSLLLQSFINTERKNKKKHDYRLVVVDGKVVASIQRNSVGNDFRTNASRKEDCEKAYPDESMQKLAVDAARAVGLDCAGVDIAEETETGKRYVYEVNGNFNFQSTEKFSRVNVAKEIAEYAVRLANKETSTFQNTGANSLDQLFTGFSSDKGIPFDDFTDGDIEDPENSDLECFSQGNQLDAYSEKPWLKSAANQRALEAFHGKDFEKTHFGKINF